MGTRLLRKLILKHGQVPEMNKLLKNTEQKTAKQVAAFPKIWVTSSEKDIGITELRAHIAKLALTH